MPAERRRSSGLIVIACYHFLMSRYAPGVQVSHFRLEERLGSGATGEVFRANDLQLDRRVAIKFLMQAGDAQRREGLLREARLCASLTHPNIAIIYEIGWDADAPFVVMELVEGELLSLRIRSGQVTRSLAFRYMRQILEALDEAHMRSIVHGDIKSSNIVIDRRDQVKILDFGLARKPGTIGPGPQGTLEFLAPELARGEVIREQSDLFSAGVVFYHMLSGR